MVQKGFNGSVVVLILGLVFVVVVTFGLLVLGGLVDIAVEVNNMGIFVVGF